LGLAEVAHPAQVELVQIRCFLLSHPWVAAQEEHIQLLSLPDHPVVVAAVAAVETEPAVQSMLRSIHGAQAEPELQDKATQAAAAKITRQAEAVVEQEQLDLMLVDIVLLFFHQTLLDHWLATVVTGYLRQYLVRLLHMQVVAVVDHGADKEVVALVAVELGEHMYILRVM
jgi:hypothetical protein